MNKKEIQQLLDEISEDAFFAGKANEEKILFIECQLDVILPETYKWFLKEFGHGGVSGFMIIGNGISDTPAVIKYTNNWRNFGLDKKLVVIEDDGTDWIYCLDTSKLLSGKCPVVDWSQSNGIGNMYYDDFLDFFENQIRTYSTN